MKQIQKVLNSAPFKQFEEAFLNGRLSHAYLVVGPRESAKLFCKALTLKLVCEGHKPCLNCPACKKIEADFHPDVLVYPKGKNFVVADSEDILSNAVVKPLESEYKIFLINDMDGATPQAQNKLLKTVEEAPKNVVFLFNAENAHGVLQTIKSRTQIIEVGDFADGVLEEEAEFSFLVDMLENMMSSRQTLKYAVKFAEKSHFEDRLVVLGQIFEKVLYAKFSNGGVFQNVQEKYPIGAIGEILELITLAKRQFESNVSTNLITDNLLLKILEVRYKWSKSC